MKVHSGLNKIFQICGILAVFVLIVILPVSAAGFAPVISPGVLPYMQREHFTLPAEPGGY